MLELKSDFIVVDINAEADALALAKLEGQGYIIVRVNGDPNKVLVRHEQYPFKQ